MFTEGGFFMSIVCFMKSILELEALTLWFIFGCTMFIASFAGFIVTEYLR
jgi:hypothetical protein